MQAFVRRGLRGGDVGEHIDLALRHARQHVGEQFGLGGEVAIHRTGGNPGGCRHVGNLRFLPSALADESAGGVKNAGAVIVESRLNGGGLSVGQEEMNGDSRWCEC